MSYDDWNPLPNKDFFVKCVSAYDCERELYDVLQMEGFNHHAVPMRYYTVSISADKLYGEDNARVIQRAFDYNAHYELPKEEKMFSSLGTIVIDNFPIYISMIHFTVASQYHSSGTSGFYPSYSPKIGDIVYAKYNDKFYEVNMVKEEDNIFLQGKHTWTLQLIEFKNKGYLVSEELFNMGDYITTSASGVGVQDIYALNDIIDDEKKNFLYEPDPTECEPKDPFNSWWTDRI
jgi:hypothetical protein